MNQPLKKTNPITACPKPIRANDDSEHCLHIQLDQQRAAGWLVCIEELIPVCQAIELELFFDELSDACWLARWKREDALVKFDPLLLPALVSALASDVASNSCLASVVEDIITTLSRARV